jgi:hypothetical protein
MKVCSTAQRALQIGMAFHFNSEGTTTATSGDNRDGQLIWIPECGQLWASPRRFYSLEPSENRLIVHSRVYAPYTVWGIFMTKDTK